MDEVQVGQRWTHKLTSMAFRVAVIDGNDVMLEPEGDGREVTLTVQNLIDEFKCPMVRRSAPRSKKQKRIKPGKIRRGVRR